MFLFSALMGGAFGLSLTLLLVVFPFTYPVALWTKSPLFVLIGCILITAVIGFWIYRKKA